MLQGDVDAAIQQLKVLKAEAHTAQKVLLYTAESVSSVKCSIASPCL